MKIFVLFSSIVAAVGHAEVFVPLLRVLEASKTKMVAEVVLAIHDAKTEIIAAIQKIDHKANTGSYTMLRSPTSTEGLQQKFDLSGAQSALNAAQNAFIAATAEIMATPAFSDVGHVLLHRDGLLAGNKTNSGNPDAPTIEVGDATSADLQAPTATVTSVADSVEASHTVVNGNQ